MNHATITLVVSAFRAFFERSVPDVDQWLCEDAEWRTPIYYKCWKGKELVRRLLSFAALELDSLQYIDTWEPARRSVFRFEGTWAHVGRDSFARWLMGLSNLE